MLSNNRLFIQNITDPYGNNIKSNDWNQFFTTTSTGSVQNTGSYGQSNNIANNISRSFTGASNNQNATNLPKIYNESFQQQGVVSNAPFHNQSVAGFQSQQQQISSSQYNSIDRQVGTRNDMNSLTSTRPGGFVISSNAQPVYSQDHQARTQLQQHLAQAGKVSSVIQDNRIMNFHKSADMAPNSYDPHQLQNNRDQLYSEQSSRNRPEYLMDFQKQNQLAQGVGSLGSKNITPESAYTARNFPTEVVPSRQVGSYMTNQQSE